MAIEWRLETFIPVDDANMQITLARYVDDVFDFAVTDIVVKVTTVADLIKGFATLARQKLVEREASRLPYGSAIIETKLIGFEQRVQNS